MHSSKPKKVRRLFFNAPNHVGSASIASPLDKELREKYGIRSVRIRKKDSVKVMRGEYAGVEGKVLNANMRSGTLAIEGVTREKIAGGTVPVRIHASKVMATALDLGDKLRREKLEGASGKEEGE